MSYYKDGKVFSRLLINKTQNTCPVSLRQLHLFVSVRAWETENSSLLQTAFDHLSFSLAKRTEYLSKDEII